MILPNCTTIYAQPSGAVHSIWWLGLIFFDLFSRSGLRAFCTNDFANCTTNLCNSPKITPTIRCCEQHLVVGFNFFLTSAPILDLGHFSQMILPIALQFMPNHQMLFTASDVLGYFFLTCSPILDLGHFAQMILRNWTTNYASSPKNNPNHQVLFTASDGWCFFFFWPVFPFWTEGIFHIVILPIVLQIMPQPIRC